MKLLDKLSACLYMIYLVPISVCTNGALDWNELEEALIWMIFRELNMSV